MGRRGPNAASGDSKNRLICTPATLQKKRRDHVSAGQANTAPQRLQVLPQFPNQRSGHARIATFVSQKSAMRIVIEMTTTVRVVLLPTPAVPPRVVIPQ